MSDFLAWCQQHAAAFASRVQATEGCWEWQGHIGAKGYGVFNAGYRQALAHRVAYAIARGVDPGPSLVCHSCDNRKCCNPSHLFLSDAAGNSRDAVAKGRIRHGEGHPYAKLTDWEVVWLRALLTEGRFKLRQARKRLPHTSEQAISRAAHGHSYRHLPTTSAPAKASNAEPARTPASEVKARRQQRRIRERLARGDDVGVVAVAEGLSRDAVLAMSGEVFATEHANRS